jgi:endonuclease/exonuclease/phosphatase family metal-dependent hydrolase
MLPGTTLGDTVTVRVATFNIQNYDGSSPQFEAARDVLVRVGADVVCLQEMGNASEFADLAAVAGYPFFVLASANGDIDNNNDFAGVMSMHPFVSTATETSVSLSGDPNALDLTRNFIVATIDIPDATGDLSIAGNHWKAGFSDADEFRRSIESIRAMQTVEDLDSSLDAFLIVGDMNDDIADSPDDPSQFNSLPSGLPVSFELGNDISFPVINSVFNPLQSGTGSANLTVINALQLASQSSEPLDSTRPSSGRRLDYLWYSDAITLSGSEVYDSRDEGLGGGGLPKVDPPLPSGTSATASDHLLVFADLVLEAEPPPAGACCEQPGGICTDDVDEAACTAVGGFFYGPGTACDNLPGPPCEPAGACCQLGGVCVEHLGEVGCAGVGGFFYGVGTTCAGPLDPPCEPVSGGVIINEVLATHDGTDTKEFVELLGLPSSSLDGMALLVIEGQTASKGVIDDLIDLTGRVVGADGYFVIGDSGLSEPPPPLFDPPDLSAGASNIFENGSETFLLVEDLPGTVGLGDDVDADNDGVADPGFDIGTIVDSVGLVGGSGFPDFAIYYGAPALGPQASVFPAGAGRSPNGVDTDTVAEWQYLSRLLDGSDGDMPVTPGSTNPAVGGSGDFDGSGRIDLADFAAFQRCFTGADNGPPQPGCEAGDLDGDSDEDLTDLLLFESLLQGP